MNDEIVYCCVRKPGTKDDWEDLAVIAGQVFEYEYPAKAKPVEEVKGDDGEWAIINVNWIRYWDQKVE